MNRPNDWDSVQEFGEYTALPAGAYACKIIKVEQTTSNGGKPMIRIALDIADGEYAGYFRKQYDADTRADKKWGCIVNQVLTGKDGSTARGFKTFVTSVERSSGTQAQWGDAFLPWLKGKKVGALFRREEYLNAKGERKWSTKCFSFRSFDSIDACEIPQDKPLQNAPAAGYGYGNVTAFGGYNDDGFRPLPDDEDVPFNF